MRKRKIGTTILAAGICACLLGTVPVTAEEAGAEQTQTASVIATNDIAGWPQGPEITSTAAVIMEDSTNTVLYSKNMDQPLYPGGAVKIMTSLLALENSQLTDPVTMTATGVSGVTDGGVHISAQLDETFTMEQCLYAIMVGSANDIALQVAEQVGGSVEAFVEKMNTRAAELGCTDTVFTNPTGLPDENQHTTAHDLALIMQEAIHNETFCTIARTTTYTIPATNMSGGARNLTNKFTMIDSASDAYYQGCLGGKEGFTQASLSTLVCAATRNDMTLISVVLQGASGQTDDESITTLDYGFNNFQKLSLGDDDFNVLSGGTVVVPMGTTEDNLSVQEDDDGEEIHRQYLFSGVPVGTAILEEVRTEEKTVNIDGEANMQAAKKFSDSHTYVPYYVIGGVGVLLLVLLMIKMVKIIKS